MKVLKKKETLKSMLVITVCDVDGYEDLCISRTSFSFIL